MCFTHLDIIERIQSHHLMNAHVVCTACSHNNSNLTALVSVEIQNGPATTFVNACTSTDLER